MSDGGLAYIESELLPCLTYMASVAFLCVHCMYTYTSDLLALPAHEEFQCSVWGVNVSFVLSH